MTGKERVLRTLEFKNPDRIPVDLWVLPAAQIRYGKKLEALLEQYDFDIGGTQGPFDHGFTPEYYVEGTYTDPWGCVWINRQAGIIGEVKEHILGNDNALCAYKAPVDFFAAWWDREKEGTDRALLKAREQGKFILGGWISIFERMQFLRGTEELFCDIALKEGNTEKLAEIVMEFYHVYLDKWLECDIDGVIFGDDWGSQKSSLISPEDFRLFFKPLYKTLIKKIKDRGKKVFFHSDGYILDLYDELIDLGVDAVNSQLSCMGVEKAAEKHAGKITFWGEPSRQSVLPFGTPEDVREEVSAIKDACYVNGGGLIGLGSMHSDVSLANLDAMLQAWNE